jgi:hypothetical protein
MVGSNYSSIINGKCMRTLFVLFMQMLLVSTFIIRHKLLTRVKHFQNPGKSFILRTKLLTTGSSLQYTSGLQSQEQSFILPAKLKIYISDRIIQSLSENDIVDQTKRHEVAQKLFEELLAHPVHSKSSQQFSEAGQQLCSFLLNVSAPTFRSYLQGKLGVDDFLRMLKERQEHARGVFDTITNHHRSISNREWSSVASNTDSLAKYSNAASAMGSKRWVAEGNRWMEDVAVSYFRYGGARKHYLKKYFKEKGAKAGIPLTKMDLAEKHQLLDSLAKDLMVPFPAAPACTVGANPAAENQLLGAATCTDGVASHAAAASAVGAEKIRLLDVGSCYNPFVASPHAALLDVTALDLHPAEGSPVLQCDFLNLAIGPEGSQPVVVGVDSDAAGDAAGAGATGSTAAHEHLGDKQQQQQQVQQQQHLRKLVQLPAASFDVVTMSLVLSYLPTPEQREAMVFSARRLLVSPPPPQQQHSARTQTQTQTQPVSSASHESTTISSVPPHRTGLLVIVEKESIFGKEHTIDTVGLNKAVFLTNWKDAIAKQGFELVKYQQLKCDDHWSHGFVFATTPLTNDFHEKDVVSAPCLQDITSERTAHTNQVPGQGVAKMWIKQDFCVAPIADDVRNSDRSGSDVTSTDAGGDAVSRAPSCKTSDSENISAPATYIRPIGIVGGGIGGCALGNESLFIYLFIYLCMRARF